MRNFLLTLFICGAISVQAQFNLNDTCIAVPLLQFSYAGQLPGGDMAKRFGFNSNIGLNYTYKTHTNWLFGVDFTYLFGNEIRESGLLDSISTHYEHSVINVNGEFADVRLWERGFSSTAWVGKLWPVFGSNPNSGIVTNFGLGFLEHHIKIEDIGNQSPQLVGDLKKGYDRLTNGPSVSEYVGYMYMSNNRLLNFFVGIECSQAFTKDRRIWDYEMMKPDDAQRIDLLYGMRAGWILPLYKRMPKAYYYY